jgi:hypothetical protein
VCGHNLTKSARDRAVQFVAVTLIEAIAERGKAVLWLLLLAVWGRFWLSLMDSIIYLTTS